MRISVPTRAGLTGPGATGSGQRPLGGEPRLLRWFGGLAASVPLLALLFVLAALLLEALTAIKFNGVHFFYRSGFSMGNTYGSPVTTHGISHPVGAFYGALPLITGTLASSLLALVIAVPVALGAALAVTERLPARLSTLVGFFLELLAGVPSVVVGLWGTLTFGPVIARDVAPLLARHAPDVPVLDFFRGSTGNGQGLLTSGLILALMIIPIVAATSRDLLRQVPILPREGAQALGLSDWEVTRRVTLPWVRPGIIGAVVLGLGRALGETIAVAMVSGVALGSSPRNLYEAMTTIAATIVSQLDSALTDPSNLAVKTLAEAGLVLMVITLGVNVAARVLVRRVAGTALPVGRGV